MGYKCSVCGTNDVDYPGGVCELCSIGQDPFASGGGSTRQVMINNPSAPVQTSGGSGKSRRVLLGGGNSIPGNNISTTSSGTSSVPAPAPDTSVKVYQAGQVPAVTTPSSPPTATQLTTTVTSGPLASGIVKNVTTDTEEKATIVKLFRTLFQGIPYMIGNDMTMFQVFPDYSGTAVNSMGNACDQVIVYGKLNAGTISENNDVEVYGHRDTHNNIVASKIVNKASGTVVKPTKVIPAGVIWALTILVLAALGIFAARYGKAGIIWAIVIFICLTNLSTILKILAFIFGILFTFRLFRNRRNR